MIVKESNDLIKDHQSNNNNGSSLLDLNDMAAISDIVWLPLHAECDRHGNTQIVCLTRGHSNTHFIENYK
jgi:hypothetical protein